MNRLIEEGRAPRPESINAYVAGVEPHRHHDPAIFAIFRDRGSIEQLFDASILRRLHAKASKRSFEVKNTTIEMRGQCADCRAE